MIGITPKLLSINDEVKSTRFITLSRSDADRNKLLIKKAIGKDEITEIQSQKLDKLSANPHFNRSLGFFSENNLIEEIEGLPSEYDASYDFKRFFILPFCDYKLNFLHDLYLLKVSIDKISLYKVKYSGLDEVELDLREFKSILANRLEDKSMQAHGGSSPVFNGQGASDENNRKAQLLEAYLTDLANVISTKFLSNKGRLIIAGVKQHIDLIQKTVGENHIAPFNLEGNFDDTNSQAMLNLLIEQVNLSQGQIAQETIKGMSLNASQHIQDMSFLNIISEIHKGRVETFVIGKLGADDFDYTNPIAPLGANYLALEVIKKGGDVIYFPDYDFETSTNNLIYKLRY